MKNAPTRRGPGRPPVHKRNSPFGELLRDSRRRCGLSVAEVAGLVGKSATSIYKIEQGAVPPPEDSLISQLAVLLGIEPDVAFFAAGRLTPDLVSVFQKRPESSAKLIRKANKLGYNVVMKILDNIESGLVAA